MARSDASTPETRARKRVAEFRDLMWHIGVFGVVNAFLWVQDIVAGGGLDYAYWATIPWGIGLLIHITAFLSGRRHPLDARYDQYLEEERRRELQSH